jgi:multidrug efflux pump
MGAQTPDGDAAGRGGTLALTSCSISSCPKGFFPVQDTGVIQGISEAPQTISFPAMAARQQALAEVILKDPAVESLSSFIGVDGINTTLNSGRILINLKPLEERLNASTSSAACSRNWPRSGITLFHAAGAGPDRGRPRQPHAIPVHAGRPDPQRTEHLDRPKLMDKAQACPAARLATDQQTGGRHGPRWSSTAHTASRLGNHPQMIDDTLYDAFGQRQVSTLFTQLNQYHVVLEGRCRSFRRTPSPLKDIYVQSTYGGAVPLSAFTHFETPQNAPLVHQSSGAVSRALPFRSIWRRAPRWATPPKAIKTAKGTEHAA